jgi:hypothetical protein
MLRPSSAVVIVPTVRFDVYIGRAEVRVVEQVE